MRVRVMCAALVLTFGAVLAVQGQGPPGARMVVVTGEPSLGLIAWKASFIHDER